MGLKLYDGRQCYSVCHTVVNHLPTGEAVVYHGITNNDVRGVLCIWESQHMIDIERIVYGSPMCPKNKKLMASFWEMPPNFIIACTINWGRLCEVSCAPDKVAILLLCL